MSLFLPRNDIFFGIWEQPMYLGELRFYMFLIKFRTLDLRFHLLFSIAF